MASTTELGVVYANLGLKGSALAATSYTAALTSATTSLRDYANAQVSATQAAETDSAFATTVMANLGLTASVIGQAAYDALQPALAAYVNSVGAANRGVVVVQLAQIVAGLTADATFGAAAINLNAGAATAYTYSTTAANTTDKVVSLLPTAVNFTLTTSVDVKEGSTTADTFTATSSTLAAADVIADSVSGDGDVMNITLNSGTLAAATIRKIESINVNVNKFAGSATDVDATNITGATINLSSAKLGYDGVSGVAATGANNVTAGAGVTNLTVAGLTTGTVDTGSATTAAVTGTAAVANKIIVNNTIGLTNTTSTKTTLEVTKDATITYDTTAATNATTVTGAGNVTLKMAGADVITGTSLIDSNTGTIALRVTSGAAFDATNFATDKIIVGDVATVAATVASGATLETNADLTSLTVITTSTAATTANITAGHNITTLDVSDSKLTTTVNANTADITIGTLTSLTGNTVKLAGSKNVVVSASSNGIVDASGLGGSLDFTATTGTTQTVTGSSSAANTVALGATAIVTYTGGSGVDTIAATAVTSGTVGASTGAGNDIVKLGGTLTGTIALDGGDGTDSLYVNSGTDVSGGTFSIAGFENLQMRKAADNLVDNLTLAAKASQLTGKTLAVSSQEGIDTVALTVTGAGKSNTIDLSGLTMEAGDTVSIAANASTSLETIKGTNVADTFLANTGLHSFTGGAGNDVFSFTAGDSSAAVITKITDFQANALSADHDKLVVDDGDTGVAVAATGTFDVSSAVVGESTTVNAVVASGFMTLSGLSADVALFKTLNDYIAAAKIAVEDGGAATATDGESIAFIYGGNTYVYTATAVTAGAVTSADIVELTGLTTATKLATAAAANTVWIG